MDQQTASNRALINRCSSYSALTALILGLSILVAEQVSAQSSDASTTESGDNLEEIVVTGSSIRRDEFHQSSPMQTVDIGDIEATGGSQIQDLFKTLTVNTGSELFAESGDRAGISQFSLRGLGVGSTLTLVNGRRAGFSPIADATGSDFVDINQFPTAMIERIEVLTDGASAIYGSDAVAGVVNIITRKGFEGLELSADYRDASNRSYSLSAVAGGAFDKGSFNFYGTFYDQTLNDRKDFDWLDERILGNGDRRRSRLLSTTGSPGNYRRALIDADGNPALVPGATRLPDADCEAAGGIFRLNDDGSLDTSRCRYDFSDQIGPISAEQRYQGFTEIDYQLSDRVTLFGEASFSRNVIRSRKGASVFNNGAVVGSGAIYVPGDHPFNFYIADPADATNILYIGPDTWDNTIHTGVDLVAEARPFGAEFSGENSRRDTRRELNYFRAVTGFEIELPGDWTSKLSYQYASGYFVEEDNGFRADIFNQLVIDGIFNPFGTRITQENLVSPKDGSSLSGNPEEVLLRFDGESIRTLRTEQKVVDFIATGDAFEMPNGPVSVALGAQFRDQEFRDNPDTLLAASEGSSRGVRFPSLGSQGVWAVYGEAIIPVLEMAELQLAVRHEDFDGEAETTDPKLALSVFPNEWLTLRGSWGSSFQAPSLQQVVETLTSQVITDSSLSGGGCAAGGGDSISVLVSSSAGDGIEPQSADSFNIGATFMPLPELTIDIDYWNYDYTDLIAPSENAQAIVDSECAGGPDPRVARDASGQINRIDTEFTNIGSVEANGIDVAVAYDLATDSLGGLFFDFNATYINEFVVSDGGTSFDAVGSRNFTNNFGPQPQLRANGGVTWSSGPHSANVIVRYIDSYDNDQSNDAPIDSFTTVDLQYSVTLDRLLGGEGTTLTFGANNVLDEDPPALERLDGSGTLISGTIFDIDRPGYDPRVHDIRGRILYVRVKKSF